VLSNVQRILKVKWCRYRPGVAHRVGGGIALLFHDRGWVVSSTSRPHFTPGKGPVPILQEAGWAPGPVWRGGKSRPHRDSIPDRPARSQPLYQLSYPAHVQRILHTHTHTHTHTHRGCQTTYTHFKKGKNNIKIVIFNLYRWLSCLSHGDTNIHLINAIFWANALLTTYCYRNSTSKSVQFSAPLVYNYIKKQSRYRPGVARRVPGS